MDLITNFSVQIVLMIAVFAVLALILRNNLKTEKRIKDLEEKLGKDVGNK